MPIKTKMNSRTKKDNYSVKDILVVISQFLIIVLHFLNLDLLTQRLIKNDIYLINYLGTLFVLIGLIIIILSLKNLKRSASPMPKPIDNSKLITSGIYSITRHPMYYSLIMISIGFLLKTLTLYNLLLTIFLSLIVKIKIGIEEKYLIKKYKNYKSYKERLRF